MYVLCIKEFSEKTLDPTFGTVGISLQCSAIKSFKASTTMSATPHPLQIVPTVISGLPFAKAINDLKNWGRTCSRLPFLPKKFSTNKLTCRAGLEIKFGPESFEALPYFKLKKHIETWPLNFKL